MFFKCYSNRGSYNDSEINIYLYTIRWSDGSVWNSLSPYVTIEYIFVHTYRADSRLYEIHFRQSQNTRSNFLHTTVTTDFSLFNIALLHILCFDENSWLRYGHKIQAKKIVTLAFVENNEKKNGIITKKKIVNIFSSSSKMNNISIKYKIQLWLGQKCNCVIYSEF